MMSRFTERGQEVLQRAQQIMFAKQHTQLDVEHIFLALLQQNNSLPAQIVMQLGGDAPMMTQRLQSALNSVQSFAGGRGVTTGYITLRANRVLQGAVEEADSLGDDFISTEHIFLALAKAEGGAAGRILRDAGITHDKILAALPDLSPLRERRPSRVPEPRQTREKQIVNPDTLARPVGFSHGIVASGRMLFLAGQTAMDAEGKIVSQDDIVGQYRQVLHNLREVVRAAGGDMSNIAKMTIFVQSRDGYKAHLKELGGVHKEFFGSYYPAMALLEISRFFDDGVLVEIEGIAVLSD